MASTLFSRAEGAVRRAIYDSARSEALVRDLLSRAGVTIGGEAPQDLVVHDSRFYARVLRDGSLGFGESYVEGWWDSRALDQTIAKLLAARLDSIVRENWHMTAHVAKARLLNLQSAARALEIGARHYDLGNEFYEAMLDRRMVYTCAYWKDATDLDAAQEAKLDLVCRKIGLARGMKVLDLGCGWGGFAHYAAERYGAEVTGYSISKEQVLLGRERCKGLPVEIHHADYREASGSYDAVISIGLLEHVGMKNYTSYMELVDRCLAPGGIAFVHTIAGNASRNSVEPWMDKYIFPDSVVPSLAQLGTAIEERFSLEDLQNLGPNYDRTLMAWHARFEDSWPRFAPRYGDRFHRMWNYYLLGTAAAFRVRYLQLYQLVLTRVGTPQPACRAS